MQQSHLKQQNTKLFAIAELRIIISIAIKKINITQKRLLAKITAM